MDLFSALNRLDEMYLSESQPLQNILNSGRYRSIPQDELLELVKMDPTSDVDRGKAGDYTNWLINHLLTLEGSG